MYIWQHSQKYVNKWNSLSLSYEEFCGKSDEDLTRLFSVHRVSAPPTPHQQELERLLPAYYKKLSKRGVTTLTLHGGYLRSYPDGYSLSQFRSHLRHHLQFSKTVMRIEHKAGDKMYVDYAGDKLHLILPAGTRLAVEVLTAFRLFSSTLRGIVRE